MCGLAGFFGSVPHSQEEAMACLRRMGDAIAHRGPDSDGRWFDPEAAIGLEHRRLAIVDLSEHGAQPMTSSCGRYVLAYNGEVYNHLELRDEYAPQSWRGHSDTETILAGFTRDGVLATLPRLEGMFALAVWDRQARKLTLARDRMGEKPLYYGRLSDGAFVFGSELKALRAHPRWSGTIDRQALAQFMRYSAVPGQYTIHAGIKKLEPGCWLEVGASGQSTAGRFWDVREVARQGLARRLDLPDDEAVTALESVLGKAVRRQMLADVPLGAFLSGGVDSSAVVALMAQHSSTPIRTFTIGFAESAYNEAEHAKAVARHLGTQHEELYVAPEDALAVIPGLPRIYDEPFADPSQIPTLLLSRMTRQHVTVALSGDGGDELFAGYNRYLIAQAVWPRIAPLPVPLRKFAARALIGVKPDSWHRLHEVFASASRREGAGSLGEKMHKFAANVLPAADLDEVYRNLVSQWPQPAEVVLGGSEPDNPPWQGGGDFAGSTVERMSLFDQCSYLPDDILTKVDRASMAVSLESRVPMLDRHVVEFAWRLPMHQKMRDGSTKWLLRQMLYRHVPRELIERPKQGFAVPLDRWLRGPLRDWAQGLLDPARLRAEGFFDAEQIERCWHEHQQGRRNWQYRLWNVLMFQAWHEAQQTSGVAGT